MPETQMKRCSKCGETKALDLFHRNRKTRDGRHWWCRSCESIYQRTLRRSDTQLGERLRARDKERGRIRNELARDPDHKYTWTSREGNWRRQGIRNADGTPFLQADYHRLSELQGGVCALCGRHPPMWSRVLSVDHNSKTGTARGLLCDECNRRAVGMFEKWGRFTTRTEVNDLIRSYLANPPASCLSRAEETDGLEPQPIITSVIISPPRSTISWTPMFSHQVIINEETP